MNSKYDYILGNLKFSYSSANTFNTCAYAFKLTYIDAVERENNFFGVYGSFMHLILEKYFNKELDFLNLPHFMKKIIQNMSIYHQRHF